MECRERNKKDLNPRHINTCDWKLWEKIKYCLRIIQVLKRSKNRDVKLTIQIQNQVLAPVVEGLSNPSTGPYWPDTPKNRSISVSTRRRFAKSVGEFVKERTEFNNIRPYDISSCALNPETPPLDVRFIDVILPRVPGEDHKR